MFVNLNRNVNVLSRPSTDESRILDIYNDENDEECFLYEFFFMADMRAALNSSNFNVRMSIRKKLKTSRVTFLSHVGDVTPGNVIQSFYSTDSQNKEILIANDKRDLIDRVNIDLTEYISNKKLKNRKRLSDRALFGTVQTTEVFEAGILKNQGINSNLPQRDLVDPNIDVSEKSFIKNYQIAIKNGVDPSFLSRPRDTMTKADPRKKGSFVVKRDRKKDSQIQGAIDTTVSIIERDSLNKKNVSSFSDSDLVSLTIEKVNRVKLISKKIQIKKRDLSLSKFFYVKLDLISEMGVILQSIQIKVDHDQNVEDYYVPRSIASIRAQINQRSPEKYLGLSVAVKDQTVRGYTVIGRKISQGMNYQLSQFSTIESKSVLNYTPRKTKVRDPLILSQGGGNKSVRERNPVEKRSKTSVTLNSENCMYIVRALTTGFLGTIYGNFTSSSVKTGAVLTNRVSIYTKEIESGIIVSINSTLPDHVSGVCFVRRDITHGVRRKWVNVTSNDGREINQNDPTVSASELAPFCQAFPPNSQNTFSIVDKNVVSGRVYEYKAKLYMRNGISKQTLTTRTEKRFSQTQGISASFSNFSYEVSNETSTGIKVTFDLSFEIPETEASQLLEMLAAAGLTDIYSDDLSELKENLTPLIAFRVERFNIKTGETFSLGVATAGSFSDDGITTMGPPPSTLSSYIYRARVLLTSPQESIEAVSSQFSPTSDLNIVSKAQISSPMGIQKLRTSANNSSESSTSLSTSAGRVASFDIQKTRTNLSVSSILKGTLSNETQDGDSSIDRYPTGDFVDYRFSTGSINISIKPGNITFGGHGGTVLRWSVTGENQKALQHVDYFVVVSKKQGLNKIVGNCNASHTKDSFVFIDYANVGYVGNIEYSAYAVFLDGSISNKMYLGKTIIPSFDTKFRRGN